MSESRSDVAKNATFSMKKDLIFN